jgi:ribosomal protein L24E
MTARREGFAAIQSGLLGLCCLVAVGCSRQDANQGTDPATAQNVGGVGSKQSTTADKINDKNPGATRRKPAFGGNEDVPVGTGRARPAVPASSSDSAAVVQKLKPLQVIVGKWEGIPRKQTVDTDQPAWRWDYSNPGQPALAFESKDGGYFKSGRLTWLPEENQFRLIAVLRNGKLKTYRGDSDARIQDVPAGDGKTLDRTFTLTFTQVDPPPKTREDLYRIAIQQVKNDRYLLIVSRKAGTRVAEVNRIGNQRTGTPFAAKLDDYGDKTCVISQGLGTIAVTHNGKTYYVCCSGCRKAFEAEPEKWIASFEEWKRKKGKR